MRNRQVCSTLYEDQCKVRNQTQCEDYEEDVCEEYNEEVCSTDYETECNNVEDIVIEEVCEKPSRPSLRKNAKMCLNNHASQKTPRNVAPLINNIVKL